MQNRLCLLVFVLALALVTAPAPADNYMGGDIVLGGSGPNTIRITEAPTTIAQATATAPLQAVSSTGTVSIQSSPSGAAITLDGIQRGFTPATIPGLDPGSHALVLNHDGYTDLSVPVSVKAGQTTEYVLVMTRAAATATPAPPAKKTPGFGAAAGIAALGAMLLVLARKAR